MKKLTRLQLAYLFFLVGMTYLFTTLLASFYTVLNWQLFGLIVIAIIIWLVSLPNVTPLLKLMADTSDNLGNDKFTLNAIRVILIFIGLISFIGVSTTMSVPVIPAGILIGLSLFSVYKWVI